MLGRKPKEAFAVGFGMVIFYIVRRLPCVGKARIAALEYVEVDATLSLDRELCACWLFRVSADADAIYWISYAERFGSRLYITSRTLFQKVFCIMFF